MRQSRINKIMQRAMTDTSGTKQDTSEEVSDISFEPSNERPSKLQEYDDVNDAMVLNIESRVDNDDWLLCKETILDFMDSDDSVKDKDYVHEGLDESLYASSSEEDIPLSKKTNKKKSKKEVCKRNKFSATQSVITTVAEIHLVSEDNTGNQQAITLREKANQDQNIITLQEEHIETEANKLDENLLENREENQDVIKQKIFVVDPEGVIRVQEIDKIICDTAITNNDYEMSLTKKGTARKQKRYITSLKDRKKSKVNQKNLQFNVKPPCSDKCFKKCKCLISEERRQEINTFYWNLNRQSQIMFLVGSTKKSLPKQRTKDVSQRKFTYKYFIKLTAEEDSEDIEVCKHFYLTTLGYHPKNDYAVLKAIGDPKTAIVDKRGKHTKNEKHDRKDIIEHIMSFGPAVSHYRREHAPNKKYLPSDLSVNQMYNHFKNKFPDSKCSYELYRYILKKELNISLAKLGNEECETCEIFEKHNDDHKKNPEDDCTICKSYKDHKIRVRETREEYQNDAKNVQDLRNIYYSADLQKVIMLPRMETFKCVIFCPRLIIFNESFVPIGNPASNIQTMAVIWHEAISGRRKEDITSTFYQFFKNKRDIENITLWADNCASQNKCWSLFSFLTYIINSNEIVANTITFKYFEPGHTFMSADSFHHQVELAMKRNPKIYDFDDFHKTVQSVRSGKVVVKPMSFEDFYDFEDCSSAHRLKNTQIRIYLRDIVEVQVKRGSTKLYIRKSFAESDYTELQFLKTKLEKSGLPIPVKKTAPRGISNQRKMDIITKLGPLMPSNRLAFWQTLPENDLSVDLTIVNDNGCD